MKTPWTALSLGCLIAISASWAGYRAAGDRAANAPAASSATSASRAAAGAPLPHTPRTSRANAAAATTAAPFSLQAPVAYPLPGNTTAAVVAVGDMDSDGRDELVAGWTKLAILSQTADGRLDAGRLIDNAPGATSMILANLNGDTLPDIVVGYGSGITTLVADGAGGYLMYPFNLAVWRTASFDTLAAADIDGDGDQDIVANLYNYVGLPGPWSGETLINDGSGALRRGDGTLPFASGLIAGDFDGNGLPELATIVDTAGSGLLTYASDSQQMRPRGSATLPDNRYTPTAIAAGDFDGDGRTDYALVAKDANKTMKLWLYRTDEAGQPLPPDAALDGQSDPTAALATDLDRDGRTDLVVLHSAGVSYYLQGPNGLQAPQYLPLGRDVARSAYGLAAGDLNGDGCTDLAMASGTPGALVVYGQNCAPAPVPTQKIAHDVDQDGKSDLLWRYPAGGHWGYWLMDGAQRRSASDYPLDPALQSLAVGRYAAEDRLDVLWRDRDWIWSSRVRAGNGSVSLFLQRPYPAGYRLVASGDIDGDGVDDLLWRDDANTVVAAWAMSHVEVRAGKAYHLPPSWRIAGSGDFDGDGRLDLIWTDGRKMKLWSGRKNLSFAESAMSGYPVGWELAGTGDVDGDGRADLFWRRADLNAFVVWYMDGGRRTGGDSYTVDASWRVLDSGDFDGDGKTDLVWTNGQLMQLWQSKGRSFLGLPMADYPQSWTAIKN
ncbi:hypothetical protein ABIE09_005085 [Lysobacter enzymogenes]|uniref:FG-GAP repeat domain-containing protein n=1 Tax=Lysobacter enzymogenes TaxID=69 RepID=UPI0033949042